MALNRTSILVFSAALLLAAPPRAAAGAPQDAQAEEAAAVRDKLVSSLFSRGELADRMISAGVADNYVDLSGVKTHAGARSALLEWIRRNPDEAARVHLTLEGAGGRLPDSIEIRREEWRFNQSFLDTVRALNSAAGSASVSREAMEMAARRLYGGQQADEWAPVLEGSGGASGGGDLSKVDFADFKLNKAGLDSEITRAGAWLEAARPSAAGGQPGRAYSAAFSLYREFVVAASGLKARSRMTERESAALESLRGRLRASLAALTLLIRAAELADAASALSGRESEPGAAEMAAALLALKGELEASAAAAPRAGISGLGRLVGAAEDRFAEAYLGYTVYDGLLNLKTRASLRGFSCLYDYAVYRYLAAFFPRSLYPLARAELDKAAAALGPALARAGSGDLAGALAGLDAVRLEKAAVVVSDASAHNRAVQFLTWGIFFRPVELVLSAGKARPSFRPVFSIVDVSRKR